jgi:phosphoglucosamine mutase
VLTIGDKPDGININQNCGATDLKALQVAVLNQQADLGIAFDGDGDRLMMVDHCGEVVDGDDILYMLAVGAPEPVAGVVGTVMSNIGLEVALKAKGIELQRANVGDRYVMEGLQQTGWQFGSEPSGHVLCLNKTSTGDGIVAALQVLSILIRQQKSLHEMKQGLVKYPHVLRNIRVEKKPDLSANKTIQSEIQQVEQILGDDGRLLIRLSGTEPLIRVMVEGKDLHLVESSAERLVTVISSEYS